MTATYSFLDVQATIVGPGGTFSLGSGGNAEEGIEIEFEGDKNTMTPGADGAVMHSLHAAKNGKVSIHLLKTSPLNALLSNMYNLQTVSSALHGQNLITVSNTVTGDQITCQQAAFSKHPTSVYAKEGGTNTWMFDVGAIDASLAGLLLGGL